MAIIKHKQKRSKRESCPEKEWIKFPLFINLATMVSDYCAASPSCLYLSRRVPTDFSDYPNINHTTNYWRLEVHNFINSKQEKRRILNQICKTLLHHFEMKEKNLARSTLLNCRRLYSPIGKCISSDFYNLSRKAVQVQSITLLWRQAFTALFFFCGKTIALIPKVFSHTQPPAVVVSWDERRATEDRNEDNQPLTEGKDWSEMAGISF